MKDQLLQKLSECQDITLGMLSRLPIVGDKMDTLQDFYLHCYEKNYNLLRVDSLFPDGILNEGLLYIMLSNFTIDTIRREKSRLKKTAEASEIYAAKLQTEELRSSVEGKLIYNHNMNVLDELTQELTSEEYGTLLDIMSYKMLASFKDEDGVADMKGYHRIRARITKKLNKIKEDSKFFNYLTKDDIDSFDSFDNFDELSS